MIKRSAPEKAAKAPSSQKAKPSTKTAEAGNQPKSVKRYWLVKQEPEAYSFTQFLTDKTTDWTGVRNFQARNFLQEMKVGEAVFYYHSVSEKAVVGLATVEKEAFPDPTQDPEEKWVCVTLKAVRAFTSPITLAQIKAEPKLVNLPLIKQSRLSVMPVPPEMAEVLLSMGHAE